MENKRLLRFEGFFGEFLIKKLAKTQLTFHSAMQLDIEIAKSLVLSGVGKICFLLSKTNVFECSLRYFRAKSQSETIEDER